MMRAVCRLTEEKKVTRSLFQACRPVLAILAACAAGTVSAQSYPTHAVRLIIPFSAGGAADVPGRILVQRMSEALGQQVVVENRPGAGSTIGADAAAKATPDG